MKNIQLDITKAACFLEAGAVKAFEPKVKAAQQALEDGTCPGNDFLGWLHLPSSITPAFLDEVLCARNVKLSSLLVSAAAIWALVPSLKHLATLSPGSSKISAILSSSLQATISARTTWLK